MGGTAFLRGGGRDRDLWRWGGDDDLNKQHKQSYIMKRFSYGSDV
jgi:hypothetical protein